MSQETIERRFETGSPGHLRLSNIRGHIDIKAGEADTISVTAVKHLKSGNDSETEIKIEQDDQGTVIIKTEYQNPISNWFGTQKPCKVDYTVEVPPDCDIQASGVSCDIKMQGVNGNLDLNTVSGKLDLQALSGKMRLNTVSGSIQSSKLSGKLDAKTVSGRLRVIDSQTPEATLKTVSGSMVLETPLTDGPYQFKSVSGAATLVVPAETSFSAWFKSVSGRMRTSLPISKDNRRGSRGSIEVLGGGPAVSHKSVSGSFRILTSENEKIVESRTAEAYRPAPKNQMAILQKIQDGEISVEDALSELNA